MGKKKTKTTCPSKGIIIYKEHDLDIESISSNTNMVIIEKQLKDCIVPVFQEVIKNPKHIRNNQVVEHGESSNKED